MKLIHTLLFVAILTKAYHLSAQDLHIFYNIENADVQYRLISGIDTLWVPQPIVKRGNLVYLHLLNFNPYAYSVSINSTDQNFVVPASGSPFTSPTAAIGGNTNELSTRLQGVQFNPVLQRKPALDQVYGKMQLGYADVYNNQVVPLLQSMDLVEQEAQTDLQHAEEIFLRRDAFSLACADIEQIRSGRYKKPETIRNICREHLQSIFAVKDINQITTGQLEDLAHQRKHINKLMRDLQVNLNKYNNHISNLELIKIQISTSSDTVLFSGINRTILDARSNGKQIEGSLLELDSLNRQYNEIPLASLSEIRAKLSEILMQNFQYDYPTVASKDELGLEVTISPTAGSGGFVSNSSVLHLPPIRVTTYGGIKINTSAGIAFGSLFEQSKVYGVRNNQIVETPGDVFAPMATSFFHFYVQSKKEVSCGGAFGLGLPLSVGGADNQSLAFLCGPSLFMGKSERAVLTIGLMGTRSTHLANGYGTGDSFPNPDAALPLIHPYKLGYFLAFSFNLFKDPN